MLSGTGLYDPGSTASTSSKCSFLGSAELCTGPCRLGICPKTHSAGTTKEHLVQWPPWHFTRSDIKPSACLLASAVPKQIVTSSQTLQLRIQVNNVFYVNKPDFSFSEQNHKSKYGLQLLMPIRRKKEAWQKKKKSSKEFGWRNYKIPLLSPLREKRHAD